MNATWRLQTACSGDPVREEVKPNLSGKFKATENDGGKWTFHGFHLLCADDDGAAVYVKYKACWALMRCDSEKTENSA